MKILLLGATGLVGSKVLEAAVASDEISTVVAPTRKPLRAQPRLINPVEPVLEQFANQVSAWEVDAVICALGTTQAKAGTKEAFRHTDYALPLIFASAAKATGVETYALVSAIGASVSSRFFYARTKGELERDIQKVGFRSLTICRPSIIAGDRGEKRFAEGFVLGASRLMAPILPKKLHVNPATSIATVLLRSVIESSPGCRWVYSEAMN